MAPQTIQIIAAHSQFMLRGMDADEEEAPYSGGNGLIWVNRKGDAAVIMTGLDTGDVPVTLDVLDAEPGPDVDPWDEVVEVGMTVTGPDLTVLSPYDMEPSDENDIGLPAGPGETRGYRLRVHARGRDRGREVFSVDADEGEEMVERYLVLIWPAVPAPEVRIKLTDEVGAEIRSRR